jgi:hypothetical protein
MWQHLSLLALLAVLSLLALLVQQYNSTNTDAWRERTPAPSRTHTRPRAGWQRLSSLRAARSSSPAAACRSLRCRAQRLLRQYLHFCTSKASKLRSWRRNTLAAACRSERCGAQRQYWYVCTSKTSSKLSTVVAGDGGVREERLAYTRRAGAASVFVLLC